MHLLLESKSHKNQLEREKINDARKRKWDLVDKRQERQRSLSTQRLNATQEYLRLITACFEKSRMYAFQAINENDETSFLEEASAIQREIWTKLSVIYALENQELITSIEYLKERQSVIYQYAIELAKMKQNNTLDIEKEDALEKLTDKGASFYIHLKGINRDLDKLASQEETASL